MIRPRSRCSRAAVWAPLAFAGFALAMPADRVPTQKAPQLPWLITGHFVYVEHTNWEGNGIKIKDENVITVDVELALARQVLNQLAVYTLDHCEFTAKGEEETVNRIRGSCPVQQAQADRRRRADLPDAAGFDGA